MQVSLFFSSYVPSFKELRLLAIVPDKSLPQTLAALQNESTFSSRQMWLQSFFVGSNDERLQELVQCLLAFHNGNKHLTDILSEADMQHIQTHGLSHLSETMIDTLLQNPKSLLQLQACILQHGDPHYWDVQRVTTEEQEQRFRAMRASIMATIEASSGEER